MMEPAAMQMMDLKNILVIVAGGVMLLLFLRWFFGNRGSEDVLATPPVHRHVMTDRRALQDSEILDALANGNKIVAIKRYRDLTGAGLKEAKDAVELYAANPFMFDDDEKPDADEKPKSEYKSSGGSLPVDAGIRELIRSGQKIQAIKAYREFTGVGLKEAKDEIDRLEWEENEAARNGSRRGG